MTIVTKPITEKKNENAVEKPLVINETFGTVEGSDHTVLDPNLEDVEVCLSATARRRVSTTTTICVFITALLVMSIGIIGGVYLYRQFSQHRMNEFRGWCAIPYERKLMEARRIHHAPGKAVFNNNDKDAEWLTGALFKEEFDLGLEDNSYEQIHVPSFEFGRQGRYIHDFKANWTGIVDYVSERCFVLPLDREHILPPRTVLDLVKKMWMGYYNVDTSLVQRTMRVMYPPVQDYEPLGRHITKHCGDFDTYILEEIKPSGVNKRSVDAQLGNGENLEFVEFAGHKIVMLSILDNGSETLQE